MIAPPHSAAVDHTHTAPINRYLLRSALVAAFGGLLFGFDTAVISGTTRSLTETFSLSPALLGVTVSSALWGTVVGAFGAGRPSDRFGRHPCLVTLAALYLASAVGCALAWSWAALIFFRITGGLAIGASSVTGPMYIAQISPAARRVRMAGMFQLNIVAGILLACLCNFWISSFVQSTSEWRWKLGMLAIPAVAFFTALFGIPESPRWLIAHGRLEEARAVLHRIGSPDPDGELSAIGRTVRGDRGLRRERLFRPQHAKPVFLAISIGMFNQLSGINAILYYLNSIVERAGFTKVSSDMRAVMIGFTNLLTVAAMTAIDHLGRRRLLLAAAIGTALCLAGRRRNFRNGKATTSASLASHRVHSLVRFLAGRCDLGLPERGLSQSRPREGPESRQFRTLVHERADLSRFPVMAARSGATPFVFFALMMAAQFFVVLRFYPETARIRLEEIGQRV